MVHHLYFVFWFSLRYFTVAKMNNSTWVLPYNAYFLEKYRENCAPSHSNLTSTMGDQVQKMCKWKVCYNCFKGFKLLLILSFISIQQYLAGGEFLSISIPRPTIPKDFHHTLIQKVNTEKVNIHIEKFILVYHDYLEKRNRCCIHAIPSSLPLAKWTDPSEWKFA